VLVQNEERDITKVIAALKKNSIDVSDWRTISPSLENVFISLLSQRGAQQESEVTLKP